MHTGLGFYSHLKRIIEHTFISDSSWRYAVRSGKQRNDICSEVIFCATFLMWHNIILTNLVFMFPLTSILSSILHQKLLGISAWNGLIRNKFLDNRNNMDSERDNVVTIFINLFNPAYAFTTFPMENILLMWTYYNNNKNI